MIASETDYSMTGEPCKRFTRRSRWQRVALNERDLQPKSELIETFTVFVCVMACSSSPPLRLKLQTDLGRALSFARIRKSWASYQVSLFPGLGRTALRQCNGAGNDDLKCGQAIEIRAAAEPMVRES